MNTTTANAILLIGHPNVGKSVLFHRLTGAYVNVSNYPDTTVEVTRANTRFDPQAALLDTPGVLALPSRSDDERATMRALLNESSRCLVQVGDAKNLRRTLTLTALLAELGVPMVLALNMHDEATARGVTVDIPVLAEELGIPVLVTVATGGEGIGELTGSMARAGFADCLLRYDPAIEADIEALATAINDCEPHPLLAARGAPAVGHSHPARRALCGVSVRRRLRPMDDGHDLRTGADPADRHHLLHRLRHP
jgi:ferrous iron transport protein B